MTKRRLASINLVWLAVPWVGIVSAGRRPIRDNSFLWHVEAGRLQAETGQVLTSDPFSAAFLGEPWRTQSWLLELIYAQLGAGLKWVGAYIALMAFVLVIAVGIAIYQQTRSARITASLLIGLELLALPYFVPRPVVVSFALLGLLALSLRTRRLRWAIPLIFWVWASAHGSFVLGGGLVVLDGLVRRDRGRIKDVVASLVTVSLTAHGWHVWLILIQFLRSGDSLSAITEWAPPDILALRNLPFTLLLIGALVTAALGRLSLRSMWVVVPFLLFGLSTVRALLPAAIVLVVWLASTLGNDQNPPRPAAGSLVASVMVVVVLIFPMVLPASLPSQIDPVRFPVEAAAALDRDRLTFHDDVIGGYLIFAGDRNVMIDDRAELFSGEFLRSMVAVRQGRPEWESFFAEQAITQVLARHSDGIVEVLADQPEWTQVYDDEEFVVWQRN